MKAEYDLARMKSRPNPYAKQLKRQLTIRMGVDIIAYFNGSSSRRPVKIRICWHFSFICLKCSH